MAAEPHTRCAEEMSLNGKILHKCWLPPQGHRYDQKNNGYEKGGEKRKLFHLRRRVTHLVRSKLLVNTFREWLEHKIELLLRSGISCQHTLH